MCETHSGFQYFFFFFNHRQQWFSINRSEHPGFSHSSGSTKAHRHVSQELQHIAHPDRGLVGLNLSKIEYM